ncbi:MAG: SDR family oxidoreductase [Candidatus Thermoplasmatota archaeon]|nr:SDR family oxidoreductase [Candidatus Thermoplasmatota archaeon]MEC7142149.1 SDR family oxidoreductase [Candidatus Thermoplasmatota archaeon]MEC7391051.1 SDR family oxidoreductase [Candidatus Thermoplasmatota archaeon]MEC7435994.1 SDR family oxidoreductase [Candidatus Thermoplasmatota archaeon]MEC7544381.1 SDR family oxidoreductase [Candidatus Thermoplasmatota archaeon]|tara:strand:- start:2278 stop:3009 length:732 start_codon:yes stop_codon:yes gene_type:complete
MKRSFLIVGGSSDIGLLLGKNILENGDNLTLLVRDPARVSELANLGATIVVGDGLDEEIVSYSVDAAKELGLGKIDGVVHLIGSLALRPPHAMSVDSFEEVIRTNLTSSFLTLSKAAKVMLRNQNGRIVFTSSVAGSLGLVNHEAIAAAKGGVEAMVRSAAATYAKRGVRINAVAPGLTNTRMAEPVIKSDTSREIAVGMIPLNRINEPEEVASTIYWLLTDAPDNITGQVFHLDGGMSQVRN